MTEEQIAFRNRVVATYAALLEASHTGKSLHVRMGADAAKAAQDFAEIPNVPPFIPATAWGYPIVVDEALPPDAIQVHAVTIIY